MRRPSWSRATPIARASLAPEDWTLASWLGRLRDDKSLVISAASKAQRAVDPVLGADAEQEAEVVADSEEREAVPA